MKDVLTWKLKGEQSLRSSGLGYTIVRAYSLNNNAAAVDKNKDDTCIAILQGDPQGLFLLICLHLLCILIAIGKRIQDLHLSIGVDETNRFCYRGIVFATPMA